MLNDRPNPDAMLACVQEESARAQRGKLKIFFGARAHPRMRLPLARRMKCLPGLDGKKPSEWMSSSATWSLATL